MQFGRDESAPKGLGLTIAGLGFEIQGYEGVKEVESEERNQQKALHGFGIMLEHVVGMPFVDQLVKTVIFNVPSLVAAPAAVRSYRTFSPLPVPKNGRYYFLWHFP